MLYCMLCHAGVLEKVFLTDKNQSLNEPEKFFFVSRNNGVYRQNLQ
jgi:hypothetical protein